MPLADLLLSTAPHAELAEDAHLYDFLVGDWETQIRSIDEDGRSHDGRGRIVAGWILEGRAVQDVWTVREPVPMPVAGNWFGTTLRVFDTALGVWRIFWIDPAANDYRFQVGVPRGADIVQEQDLANGMRSRWAFSAIGTNAFRWRGETSNDLGASWTLKVEVNARRL